MMDADVLIVFGKKRGSKDETNRPRQEVTVSERKAEAQEQKCASTSRNDQLKKLNYESREIFSSCLSCVMCSSFFAKGE